MNQTHEELTLAYREALAAYIDSGQAADLAPAYRLGRSLVARNGGLIELMSQHHGALSALLATRPAAEVLPRANTFLADCMAPFEMALGGYRDANRALVSQNRELEERVRRRVAAQERAAAQLRTILDAAPAAILVTDSQRHLTWANPSALAQFGLGPEAIGESLAVSVPAMAAYETELYRALRGAHRDHDGVPIEGASGTFHADLRFRPVRTDSGVLGLLVMVTDASERHRHEQERDLLEARIRSAQRMEAVGRLAGGIAHDFNNLLTVINGYAGFLVDLVHGEEKREMAAAVVDAGERAAALTRQLLAFSRRQVRQIELVDVHGVIGNLERMLQRLIGEDVSLRVVLGEGDPRVEADRGQLEQVVMNLVVNARDAMPDGGRITVDTAIVELAEGDREAPEIGAGRYVRIGVSDTGVGMDARTRERIFEPFFTTKEVGQGTGLGLATVHGIVRQSGGAVRVESEPDEGSRFEVFLPLSAKIPKNGDADAREDTDEHRGSGVILLTEDDDLVRGVAVRMLARSGYEVLAARDGAHALELAAARPGEIDLLVTDVVMPGMTGPELALELQARQPGVPVLFMSGYSSDARLRRAIGEGAAFIHKPLSGQSLLSAVREALAKV